MRKKLLLMLLAAMLVLSACSKQPETVTANTEVSEQVEETKVDDIKKEPTIGESTEEELKAEAEAKAKAEAEKKAAEEAAKLEKEKKEAEELKAKEAAEAAAKAEAERKAAEEAAAKAEAEKKAAEQKAAEEAAAKKEQETQQSQSSKPDSSQSQSSTPESSQTSTPESKPDTSTSSSSGGYALNEYGNPSRDIVGKGLVDYINPSDPAITRMIGVGGYHGSTPIPNPCAKIDPVSPFIGMKNPPADWPKPDASKEGGGAGEYKWDPETGCWEYFNNGKSYGYYMSLYGRKTVRCSEKKNMYPSEYASFNANVRGVY